METDGVFVMIGVGAGSGTVTQEARRTANANKMWKDRMCRNLRRAAGPVIKVFDVPKRVSGWVQIKATHVGPGRGYLYTLV